MQKVCKGNYKVTAKDIEACNNLDLITISKNTAIDRIRIALNIDLKKAEDIYKVWRKQWVQDCKTINRKVKSKEEEFNEWLLIKESNNPYKLTKEDIRNIIILYKKGYENSIICEVFKDKNIKNSYINTLKTQCNKLYF